METHKRESIYLIGNICCVHFTPKGDGGGRSGRGKGRQG